MKIKTRKSYDESLNFKHITTAINKFLRFPSREGGTRPRHEGGTQPRREGGTRHLTFKNTHI